MNAARVFDQAHYDLLNRARGDVVRALLSDLKGPPHLQTAVDVGCGLGHFSKILKSLDLDVTAVDGRQQNLDEAQRRNPNIRFLRFDVEDPAIQSLGKFDLVLCFGLLYHLENPFRAIRNLHALTRTILFIESMCAPGSDASMQLLDEYEVEDQGLNYVAFYPTEDCLVKMLYRAGFSFVYSLSSPPQHPDFHASKSRRRARTMLVPSEAKLQASGLKLINEPRRDWDLWSIPASRWKLRLGRAVNAIRGPSRSGG
ncbi:MAG TPA: class I SAM-dependent methyltransferase [Candidatus Acidoferrum sp.]|nr:class I SAM-dependent methyltransferase [Candidatus Acidoferrum sp.]